MEHEELFVPRPELAEMCRPGLVGIGMGWYGKSEAEVRLIRKKQFAYVCTMSCRPTMDWQGVN